MKYQDACGASCRSPPRSLRDKNGFSFGLLRCDVATAQAAHVELGAQVVVLPRQGQQERRLRDARPPQRAFREVQLHQALDGARNVPGLPNGQVHQDHAAVDHAA